MKGDGGRAACMGEASKLKYSKSESVGEVSKLKYSKAESLREASTLKCPNGGKSGGLKLKGEMRRVALAEPGHLVLKRRGGEGSQVDNLKWLEDQVQILKKQLEDERREQKKLLEVLTSVIKEEEPCVSLDKAENILVIFLYSRTAI